MKPFYLLPKRPSKVLVQSSQNNEEKKVFNQEDATGLHLEDGEQRQTDPSSVSGNLTWIGY